MYTLSKDILGPVSAQITKQTMTITRAKEWGKAAGKIMHFLEQTEAIYFVLTTKYEMANKKITAMSHKLLPLNTPNVHKGLT